MKTIKNILFFFLLMGAASTAFAGSSDSCTNASGSTQNENFDVTTSLTADTNVAGKTTQVVRSGDINMHAICPKVSSNKNNYTYRSYVSNYPVVETSGNWKYLSLNDYLEGALQVTDAVAGIFTHRRTTPKWARTAAFPRAAISPSRIRTSRCR